MVFEGGAAGDQNNSERQRPAQPGRLEPPLHPAQARHGDDQSQAGRQQDEAEKVPSFERVDTNARREPKDAHRREAGEGEARLKNIEAMPVAQVEKVRRDDPRQGHSQLRHADPEDQSRQAQLGRKRLQHVEDRQNTERCAGDAAERADGQGSGEAVSRQMGEGGEGVDRQEDHHE